MLIGTKLRLCQCSDLFTIDRFLVLVSCQRSVARCAHTHARYLGRQKQRQLCIHRDPLFTAASWDDFDCDQYAPVCILSASVYFVCDLNTVVLSLLGLHLPGSLLPVGYVQVSQKASTVRFTLILLLTLNLREKQWHFDIFINNSM